MDIKNIGEFTLIEGIRRHFSTPQGIVGIGDDCAVIPQRSGMETLVSTDMLMEGSHFLLGDVPARRLGWKSAAVNISDIAAMGGRPVGTFLAFALPEGTDSLWVEEFIEGYADISARFSCPLLGGDTTSSHDKMCISVTVLGEAPAGKSLKRSCAKPGDLVCVTGTLGDSAAGLRIILEGLPRDSAAERLIARHYLPTPRVEEGLLIASTPGAHAMMDISDGIGSDLHHILDASRTGAEIDVKSLPLSEDLKAMCAREGWDAEELATEGGEDYELLFTITPEGERSLQLPHSVIGRIREESGICWKGGARSDYSGFHHF